ncbi:pilus assembly FimT family protein [Clostridium grantii]|uniref:Prepilin-type N-terminal cleavage/methylation domain-containing protein n=1 Tax=Clostridium grantii DSM 8605 TaxID=1121316 RepID=A0A1M5SGA8_9CLOT|nr:prepilin-type N-terminal cleavage/methylation domain-containing protein [Clostridium grantii]SHH37546.1 prepilin-type N-terminal cleavage/methylation domain-containing protein [Clostridium grantii DSM 8605]
MKSKGFSLIEILIVINIALIFLSFTILSFVELNNRLANTMDVELCSNEIVSIIDGGKNYCRVNKYFGTIRLSDTNEVIFGCNDKTIKYKLPSKFKLYTYPKEIIINQEGEIGSACSIYYYDRKNKRHCITIRVATNYVKVKE